MRASYQSSEILNKYPIKIAQCLDYSCTNCCFETLSFSKKRVTSDTHINVPIFISFDSFLYTGLPSKKFNSPWVELLTLKKQGLKLIFRFNTNQI